MPYILGNLAQQIHASGILIVDDNEINRRFLEKTLRARGFTRLLSVGSAEEALDKMQQFRPDMLLLDIMMPGMNGFECCAEIRKHKQYSNLPVLIQTTITEPELRVKAFQNGATDFVSKPIFPDELYARVMVHLENRQSLKALQLYKSRVEIELNSARQLQQAILPGAAEIEDIKKRCKLDIVSYFQPSSEIGGDFWGLRSLDSDQLALWQVDFSGHGVASALNAFRLQAYMKDHSELSASPGEYLAHLNDKLLQLLLRGQFATIFYGIIDAKNDALTYASACVPSPIILRKGGKAEMLDGSGDPLGVGTHAYPTKTSPFALGDTLLLYSDVLTETPDKNGKYITEEDIMALLEQHPGASSEAIRDAVLQHFMRHAAEPLRDDFTLAVCSRSIT